MTQFHVWRVPRQRVAFWLRRNPAVQTQRYAPSMLTQPLLPLPHASLPSAHSSTSIHTHTDYTSITFVHRYLLSVLDGAPNTVKKGKGSPYSITERRVPELIPVLGSQPAGDVSHKPGGRLPLLSARPAVTPATLKRAATSFAAW